MQEPEDNRSWDREVDVVVVGGGGAGMAAALAAAETDPSADILLIQKIGSLGGATTMSMGAIAASETSIQEEAGISDSNRLHFRDFDKFVELYSQGSSTYFYLDYQDPLKQRDNLGLRRLLVEEAGPTIEWLMSLGCEYSGPYSESLHSKPRLYQIQPDSQTYAAVFREQLSESGVDILLDTAVDALHADDGRILGVSTQGSDSPTVRARSGVILATGDYVNSDVLRDRYTVNTRAEAIAEFNTGDGHRMATEVGAQLRNMDIQWLMFRVGAPYYVSPEFPRLVRNGAILVNQEGSRFVDETSDYDQVFEATLEEPDEQMYILFDAETAEQFGEWPNHISTWGKNGKIAAYLDEYQQSELLVTADGLSTLADEADLDTESLSSTVEAYNQGQYDEPAGQTIDRFGRTEFRDPLETPPFHLLGPVNTYSILADGGLVVNSEFQVLEENGNPIPNLYAAGAVAGDLHLFGHGHHHSWIFTSGRLAGRSAALRSQRRDS